MHREPVDLFQVPDHQLKMHDRLINWAMWVKPGRGSCVSPMFRQAKSAGRQWHVPELRPTCDTRDAVAVEKNVCHLPEKHRYVTVWYYVYPEIAELKVRRQVALTRIGLITLVVDARQMLINRMISG